MSDAQTGQVFQLKLPLQSNEQFSHLIKAQNELSTKFIKNSSVYHSGNAMKTGQI